MRTSSSPHNTGRRDRARNTVSIEGDDSAEGNDDTVRDGGGAIRGNSVGGGDGGEVIPVRNRDRGARSIIAVTEAMNMGLAASHPSRTDSALMTSRPPRTWQEATTS